jgi:hypothetical protein
MRPDKTLMKKTIKDIAVSLFIYALPIVLMIAWFHIKGEKPWQKQTSNNVKTIVLKN